MKYDYPKFDLDAIIDVGCTRSCENCSSTIWCPEYEPPPKKFIRQTKLTFF